jgi:hypothetical protein
MTGAAAGPHWRPIVASLSLVAATGPAAAGCSSSSSPAIPCATGPVRGVAQPQVAASGPATAGAGGWPLPGANPQNTRPTRCHHRPTAARP